MGLARKVGVSWADIGRAMSPLSVSTTRFSNPANPNDARSASQASGGYAPGVARGATNQPGGAPARLAMAERPWTYVHVPGENPMVLHKREWLLSNGLGGYAMGTVGGRPTRRYHGLLVAALQPPVDRVVMLNSLVETLIVDPSTARERAVELSAFQFEDGTVHPGGESLVTEFSKDGRARWAYRATIPGIDAGAASETIEISKRVSMWDGLNAVEVHYHIPATAHSMCLRLRPLVALRNSHWLTNVGSAHELAFHGSYRNVSVRRNELELHLRVNRGVFTPEAGWWHRFAYEEERSRGLDWTEDLYTPGAFTLDVRAGEAIDLAITAWVGDEPRESVETSLARRTTRREGMARVLVQGSRASADDQDRLSRLAHAADDFLVKASTKPEGAAASSTPRAAALSGTTIIAGYPWFSDWGRDAMISLPGLLLATGRLDEAGNLLRRFATHRKDGLIPNCFSESGGGAAQYNSVDAPLWFIHAASAYLRAASKARAERDDLRAALIDACLDIVDHYERGTNFGIRVDADGLVTAGDATTQLTWMDAKRDGVVFTPRHGKPVEVNALWYSGLRELAGLLDRDDSRRSRALFDRADRAGRAFASAFWDPALGCLRDVIMPGKVARVGRDRTETQVRPNQIFAVSLPHSALKPEQQRAVVARVERDLLTRQGLRTLAPDDLGYRGRFEGRLFDRDAAYHNGTVWPWLMGPFAEAAMRADGFSRESRERALRWLRPLADELCQGAALGQIAEVYDGEDSAERPRASGGCIAQAWSVAEVLRVMRMAGE